MTKAQAQKTAERIAQEFLESSVFVEDTRTFGAARWTYLKTGPFGLKDICPTCSDPKPTNLAGLLPWHEETEKKR